ncbi:MAG: RdgB/HAM1 family non-canonical purine NTP pyrophosphatase [Polyangiaceae bacterium]|nr:RdgB/HAM1 family non-canonical purine NTP pyrophosphatase [Polyangiaceae bacterium]
MTAPFGLLLATTNRGKVAELTALFGDVGLTLVPMSALPTKLPPVVEDGATFLDNALLKAHAAARATGMVTLAEDSGLEVDVLGGRPGVRSARFAKEGATDAENNALLLSMLADVDDEQRTARFKCVMVLVDPWSNTEPFVAEGRCEGVIAREPQGSGGFGYDPLFVVSGENKTMAEIAEDRKNEISHRARAAALVVPFIKALAQERTRAAADLVSSSTGRDPTPV